MTDYSNLKRLAEAATPGPWIAENSRHEGSINALDRHIGMVSMHAKVREDIPQNFANQAFIAAANPAAVLALIAEVERLQRAEKNDLIAYNAVIQRQDELRAERDQFKAEAQALQEQKQFLRNLREADGFDSWSAALVEVDKLRVEVEALRKDAERYRWLRSRDLDTISQGGVFAGLTPQNMVLNEETLDEAIDAAMSKETDQ